MTPPSLEILLTDDEPAVRLTLATLLQRSGYAVTSAASGREALEQFQRRRFDLLLLDLIMPGMTGLEVARRAREIQPQTPILILTGSGALGNVDLGDYDYMLKTASPQEVLERVSALLAQKR